MPYVSHFSEQAPDREEIDQSRGPLVVEFGTNWCGHCRAAQPFIAGAMEDHSSIRHLKIEDGKGRQLGRTFGVKLWPTLIFLCDGKEVARLVRPADTEPVNQALAQIDPG